MKSRTERYSRGLDRCPLFTSWDAPSSNRNTVQGSPLRYNKPADESFSWMKHKKGPQYVPHVCVVTALVRRNRSRSPPNPRCHSNHQACRDTDSCTCATPAADPQTQTPPRFPHH